MDKEDRTYKTIWCVVHGPMGSLRKKITICSTYQTDWGCLEIWDCPSCSMTMYTNSFYGPGHSHYGKAVCINCKSEINIQRELDAENDYDKLLISMDCLLNKYWIFRR